ncbi:MAG: hypothetical protein ACM3PT_00880 [Deltaproteobacteria bacterium]
MLLKRFYLLLIIFLIIHIILSCSGDEKPLTSEELKVADSIYRTQEAKLLPSLDTICDSVYKKNYPKMLDSIKKLRSEEVIKLLKD